MGKKEVINKIKLFIDKNKIVICVGVGMLLLLIVLFFFINNKDGITKTTVKSYFEKMVEKNDLETATFTYNVIAKKCKNENNCNLISNNIGDFEYVISCEGTVTAGINFEEVNFDLDKRNKKLLITMPEVTLKEVNVKSMKFLNGEEISGDRLPEARKLCKDTIEEKSNKDGKLIIAAQEQAIVVLESFYEKWLETFENEYKVEIN